jgi:hypothetical protein
MKKSFVFYTTALMIAAVLVFAACGSGKGGNSGGGSSSGKATPASDFSYDATEDGLGIIITGFSGTGTNVVIPAKIEGLPVVVIEAQVFYKKDTITSITIPNTVTKIGKGAFAETSITKIVIPDSVITIGYSLFESCALLQEVRLSDNITEIRGKSFKGAESLKKINLPKKLKEIGESAFSGCTELSDLVIPDEVTTVDFSYWFFNDLKLPSYAFSGCGKLPLATRAKLKELGDKEDF